MLFGMLKYDKYNVEFILIANFMTRTTMTVIEIMLLLAQLNVCYQFIERLVGPTGIKTITENIRKGFLL